METNKRKENYTKRHPRLKSGHKRNSFERFNDDLCEEITQYLSFEDKIRFECVCKQFMRCVYRRQYELMSCRLHSKSLNTLPWRKLYAKNSETESNIENILKKCKNINRIMIDNNEELMSNNMLLRVIIDNCTHLKVCIIHNRNPSIIDDNIANSIDFDTLLDFGFKFGKNLEKFYFCFLKTNIHILLQLCPNIITAIEINSDDLIRSNVSLPKLSEIQFNSFEGFQNRFGDMEGFVNKYRNTIKVFTMKYFGNNFVEFMSNLSRLEKLESLTLTVRERDMLSLTTCLQNLAVSSYRRIKHLRLDVNGLQDNYSELLQAVNRFTKLKLLRLNGLTNGINEGLSVQLLRNCGQLLCLEVYEFIDNTFCDDIHRYLPKLTTIKMHTHNRLTNRTVNSLAKLTKLRDITLWDMFSDGFSKITHNSICNLVQNCANIRSLEFHSSMKIRRSTIGELIDIAEQRTHTNFNYLFNNCSQKCYRMITAQINRWEMPLNLKIVYRLKRFNRNID